MDLPTPLHRPAAGAPHSLALLGGIATNLAGLAAESENFGMVLCSDAVVAGRYLVQLQQIDRLAQSLRELARVLAAGDPDAAVAGICLGELRSALEEACAG
jgi:ABC-type transporter Mla subunit MlaD